LQLTAPLMVVIIVLSEGKKVSTKDLEISKKRPNAFSLHKKEF